MPDVKIAAARTEQSKADKATTLERLKSKRRKNSELTIVVDGEELTLKFQSISSRELDKLRAKHPPTTAQRANGAGVNGETFAPALVAACLVEPQMTEDEAKDLWEAEGWTAGELNQLFETASALCMEGMDVPRNASV